MRTKLELAIFQYLLCLFRCHFYYLDKERKKWKEMNLKVFFLRGFLFSAEHFRVRIFFKGFTLIISDKFTVFDRESFTWPWDTVIWTVSVPNEIIYKRKNTFFWVTWQLKRRVEKWLKLTWGFGWSIIIFDSVLVHINSLINI